MAAARRRLLVDQVYLDGDYTGAGAVVFGATTMTNVKSLTLLAGHSYDLTSNDATVASGQQLEVDAHALGAGDSLTFDGSAESDGYVLYHRRRRRRHAHRRRFGTDTFDLENGGADTAYGGGGYE